MILTINWDQNTHYYEFKSELNALELQNYTDSTSSSIQAQLYTDEPQQRMQLDYDSHGMLKQFIRPNISGYVFILDRPTQTADTSIMIINVLKT